MSFFGCAFSVTIVLSKLVCQLYFQVRLVSILEEYKLTRQQKEEEKKKHRVTQLSLLYMHHSEILLCSLVM